MDPVWQNSIQTTVRAAHICMHIIVHNCHTQHSMEQFWLTSLLTSRQASQLRYCLLEGGARFHLTIPISALWSATSFPFLTGQVSLPCNMLLRTQLLYSFPLLINDISLLVSNDTNCLNLFHPTRILASTAASASCQPVHFSAVAELFVCDLFDWYIYYIQLTKLLISSPWSLVSVLCWAVV